MAGSTSSIIHASSPSESSPSSMPAPQSPVDVSDNPPPSSPSSSSIEDTVDEPEYTIVDTLSGMVELLDTMVNILPVLPDVLPGADVSQDTPCANTSEGSKHRPESTDSYFPPSNPILYLDAEGDSLSRHGELSILEIHLETEQYSHTYLIHVHVLKNSTFSTTDSSDHYNLRTILQDGRIPKVFFDVRMDSDALFGQLQIVLAGVIDLQLMDMAAKQWEGPRVAGLASCLEFYAGLDGDEKSRVKRVKAQGKRVWNPDVGGSFERFNDSPLSQEIIDYCVVDVKYMPRLFKRYNELMGGEMRLLEGDSESLVNEPAGLLPGDRAARAGWAKAKWVRRVNSESKARVAKAWDPTFSGGSSANPWYQWNPCEGW